MMETIECLEDISKEVSSESYKSRNLKKGIGALLENPTDEDFDRINAIRAGLNNSTAMCDSLCERMEALTWSLLEPNEDELVRINTIIVMGKALVSDALMIHSSLEPLRSQKVLVEEMYEFCEAHLHFDELLDDLESIYFSLPHIEGFKETAQELGKL